MVTIGALYSDAALREYADWLGGYGYDGGVLKYAYDSSRAGSKLQATPLRSALEWPLYGYPRSYWQLGQEPVSPAVAFLLGMAAMWLIKKRR